MMQQHELPGAEEMAALIGAQQPAGSTIELDTNAATAGTPEPALVVASKRDVVAFEAEMAAITERTERLVVTTDVEEEYASESFVLAKALAKRIEAKRAERKAPLLEQGRTIDTTFAAVKARVDLWTSSMEKKILAYRAEKKRRAEEEERKRQAEIKRLEDERKQKEEDDRKAREAERDKAQQEAQEAGDRLMQELGIDIDVPPVMTATPAIPLTAPPPIVAPPPVEQPANTKATTSGKTVGRIDWKWEITDRSKIPPEYWMVDEAKITKVVKAGLREIPGVRIYGEEGLSASAKRRT